MIQAFPVLFGGGGLDPDVLAWQAAIVANGGSVGPSAVRSVDAFVRGCKGDGVWEPILDMGLFAGVDNLNAALVKLKTPSGVSRVLTNNNFVGADYTATGVSAGLSGNGASKVLDTGFTPNSFISTGSGHLSVYVGSFGGVGSILGCSTLNPPSGASPHYQIESLQSRISSTAVGASRSPNASSSFELASAVSTTDLRAFRNGTQINTTFSISRAGALPSVPLAIFATRYAGVYGEFGNSLRITMYSAGSGMSVAQAAAFSARVNALMTAFGANAY